MSSYGRTINSDASFSNVSVIQKSIFNQSSFENIQINELKVDQIQKINTAPGVSVDGVIFLNGSSPLTYYISNDRLIQLNPSGVSILNDAFKMVSFSVTGFDPLNKYNVSDANYTISQNGFYFVTSTVSWIGGLSETGERNTRIVHNGNVVSSVKYEAVVGANTYQNVNGIVNALQNDKIGIQVWQNNGTSLFLGGPGDNFSLVYIGEN